MNSNSRIKNTDEEPSLRIESSAIINLRGVSTKLNKCIIFTMQTYKKLKYCSIGEKFVPMTANERKSVTKAFGSTTPQRQYLLNVCDSTLCVGEEIYIHTDPVTSKDLHTKSESWRFEQNGLSSCVDSEMTRMHQSKFLNTKLSSLDGGGVRKLQKRDTGSLVGNNRSDMLERGEVARDKGACEVEGVFVKNNNGKMGKYLRRPRNIARETES